MSDLLLGEDGDLSLVNNDLYLVEGKDAIVQHLRIRLRFFLGEWFIDETAGVPYFQSILGLKNPNLGAINSIFQREILNTPGVLAITNFVFDYDNLSRALIITFTAITTDGTINFSDIIGV